ncbi:MAG: reverse transcriptase domain-containing protein [Pseudobacter sp.]|uniref:reverse transcriptase domain-containing protein n=1 Tax=Pseudobacter sp. TaxID=2045420 RepID=UPI003F7F3712
MYEWNPIPWKQIQKNVFKLQKRIYQASLQNDTVKVRRLQKLMVSSWQAKAIAVRKVTQDNRGKRTAGIDGVKNLTVERRMIMVNDFRVNEEAKAVRRIWIPKSGKQEKRPLGIPSLRDRARQALVKLEPEWEARFEGNSYGFRSGRSAHDAVEAIFTGVGRMPKFVFNADIKACFDKIDHAALLNKIKTDCRIKRAIKDWLRAGVLDGDTLFPSKEGAPQGSIISPLLAKIALHGMETAITNSFVDRKTMPNGKKMKWKPIVVRYADDFLIFHPDLVALQQAESIARDWLSEIGQEINDAKTSIKHSFNKHEGYKPGFDFLGFTVRQHKTIKNANGIKTIISPSRNPSISTN